MLDSSHAFAGTPACERAPPMRFTFVVPGLASVDRTLLAGSRPLARLASWSQARAEPRGLAAALLAAFGAPAGDTGSAASTYDACGSTPARRARWSTR